MDHLIEKVFSHADRAKLSELASKTFKDFYTGDARSVYLANLMRAKLLLVDRKGYDSLTEYEKDVLADYLAITDANEFLEQYTETFNIDDIIESEAEYFDE